MHIILTRVASSHVGVKILSLVSSNLVNDKFKYIKKLFRSSFMTNTVQQLFHYCCGYDRFGVSIETIDNVLMNY